jgi:hypothetical protein
MPRVKAKGIDPDVTYVCWQSGVVLVDGQEHTFRRGERRLGSHPVVQNCGHYFVPDVGEMPSHWDAVVERHDAEQTPAEFELTLDGAVPEPVEREDAVVLTRDIVIRAGLVGDSQIVTLGKGTVFPASSEIAGRLPAGSFVPGSVEFKSR